MIILKELRKEKKVSQCDVATALGVTRSAYGNYELGVREPDYATLIKLADYFGVSTDYLLRGDQPTEEEKRQGVRQYELTPDREELLMYYGLLDENEQKTLLQFAKFMTDKK